MHTRTSDEHPAIDGELQALLEHGVVPHDAAALFKEMASAGNGKLSVKLSRRAAPRGSNKFSQPMPNRGLFAESPFAPNQPVTVYGARLTDSSEMDRLLRDDAEAPLRRRYLLRAKESHGAQVFDGWHAARLVSSRPGADGRFAPSEACAFRGLGALMQHAPSGEANCRLLYAPLGEGLRLGLLPPVPHLVATRGIAAGDELCFDYGSEKARGGIGGAAATAEGLTEGDEGEEEEAAEEAAAEQEERAAVTAWLLAISGQPEVMEDDEEEEEQEQEQEQEQDDEEEELEELEAEEVEQAAAKAKGTRSVGAKRAPLPPGWREEAHVTPSGRRYKSYRCADGRTAPSRPAAWRMEDDDDDDGGGGGGADDEQDDDD